MTVRDLVILFLVKKWIAMRQLHQSPQFTGTDLERIDEHHPLSGLRIARDVRASGLVDFECEKRAASRYRITAIHLDKIVEDLKRRKAKWTHDQLARARSVIQEAFTAEGIPQ